MIAAHLANADQAFVVKAPGMSSRLDPSHAAHSHVTVLDANAEIPAGHIAVYDARTDAGLIAKASTSQPTFLILGIDQQIPEGANRVLVSGLKGWLQASK